MAAKTSSLADFTRKGRARSAQGDDTTPAARPVRRRGQGETVAMTLRLQRDDWMRVHTLAMEKGLSLQALVVSGLNREMKALGLPPLGD